MKNHAIECDFLMLPVLCHTGKDSHLANLGIDIEDHGEYRTCWIRKKDIIAFYPSSDGDLNIETTVGSFTTNVHPRDLIKLLSPIKETIWKRLFKAISSKLLIFSY
ncbi:hypothetical protein [Runella sp.]|uniref:hypothetical protein n=1 Tax=Runella sp. TaxID=1960881 RepID=UPI003D0C2362